MDENARKSATESPQLRAPRARSDGPKLILAAALGNPVPTEEQAMWDAMSTEQREVAILRLKVLLNVDHPLRPLPVEAAAAETGLSLNRWYEMFAAWREKRSLSSIGIAAAMPRSRTLSYHNDLQRLVVKVVDADPDTSVSRLAVALADAYGRDTGVPKTDWPSSNTLRKFVEAELRRRAKEEEPGNDIAFDCCACELPHTNGVFVAFLAIDKGSHLVLGAALGDAADSRSGYALAAKDALDRIKRAPLDRLTWAEKLERSELVIGLDEDAWIGHPTEMAAAGLKGQLQPATRARRFGAYVRPLIGGRMGRVKFLPGKTSKEVAFARPGADDVVRFGVEVDVHNSALVPGQEAEGEERRQPPATLVTLLRRLSRH